MSEKYRVVIFGWPLPSWCSIVYQVVLEAVDPSSVVILPNGTYLQLFYKDDRLQVTETSIRTRGAANFFRAKKVFDTDDDFPIFQDNWEFLIKLLNAAAAVNALFVVYLTPEEYKRLAANDEAEFMILKYQMSKRAADLVILYKDYDEEKPAVLLCRTGQCQ